MKLRISRRDAPYIGIISLCVLVLVGLQVIGSKGRAYALSKAEFDSCIDSFKMGPSTESNKIDRAIGKCRSATDFLGDAVIWLDGERHQVPST